MKNSTIHLTEYLKLITRLASLQGHGNRHYDQAKAKKKEQFAVRVKNENDLNEK